MKTYSLCAVLSLAVLLGMSLSSFRFDHAVPNVNKTSGPTKHGLTSSFLNKHVLSGSLSGSYPSGQGFHSYGAYPLDLSNISNGSNFTIYFDSENNPNRFYVQDGVGNSWYSHNSTTTPDPYNGWIGYTSTPGPWGMSGITGPNTGSFSVTKVSGRTYTLYVETVTNSYTDYWTVTY